MYGAQLTVQDATAEADLVLWDAAGQFFGGLAPQNLADPAGAEALTQLRRCLADLRNDTPEPRCCSMIHQVSSSRASTRTR